MARVADHIAIANRNHSTLATLLATGAAHSEWVATVAFYKAIHVIEAVFVTTSMGNSVDHEDRTFKLKRDRRFESLFTHYRPLKEASTIARYLQDQHGRFKVFSDYLTPERVHSELIRHRLHQIESSASRFLSAEVMVGLALSAGLPPFVAADEVATSRKVSRKGSQDA